MKLHPGCRYTVTRRTLTMGNWTDGPARCGRPCVEGEDYCSRHVDTEDADLWRQAKALSAEVE